MSRRKMFLRMITASLLRRRSRMMIALLSIAVGATILSGLVTIYYDVPRQMSAQFRSYGANMILLPGEEQALTSETADAALSVVPPEQLIGAAKYRYVQLDLVSRQLSFTAAGTDFEEIQKTSPYFSVEGEYPSTNRQVLLGKEVADTIGASVKNSVELTYTPTVSTAEGGATSEEELVSGAVLKGSAEGWGDGMVYVTVQLDDDAKITSLEVDAASQTVELGGQCMEEDFTDQFIGLTLPVTLGEDVDAVSGATLTSTAVVDAVNSSHAEEIAEGKTIKFTVSGILETGGDEEGYIFLTLDAMSDLTGVQDSLDVMELSVSGTQEELEGYVSSIKEGGSGLSARLVKRVTNSETAVLSKLQGLVFLVTAVILVLTMICVSTTMMAVISERRKEIGLRKALGASDSSIRAEFLGEGMFLGLLGGLLGVALGFGFAQIVSINVFGSSIAFQPLLLPVTVIVSMAVSALSCLWPIKRAVAIDPALVLKGE